MMAASPGAAGQVPDLSAETAGPVLTVPGAPRAFHVMAKPTEKGYEAEALDKFRAQPEAEPAAEINLDLEPELDLGPG